MINGSIASHESHDVILKNLNFVTELHSPVNTLQTIVYIS